MRKLKLILTCLMTVIVCNVAVAQNITVKGTVKDATTGEGIPFAAVQLKGTLTGTSADLDGNYTIDVPKNGTLIFSSIGYVNQEAAVEGRAVIDILLATDAEALEEAVITIAYGAAKKSSLTGAISNINSEKIESRPTSSVTSALEGTVTGVQVNNTVGNPGSEPSIMIRGNGTINGSTSPLYVIDGVPFGGNIADLNPADIESLTVLKDAASAALYGNRAANGVILITTKKGKSGRVNVTVSTSQGVYNRGIPEYNYATADEFMDINYRLLYNNKLFPSGSTYADIVANANDASKRAAAHEYATTSIIPDWLYVNIYNVADNALFDADGHLVSNAQIKNGYRDDLNWFDQTIRNGYRAEYNVSASGASDKADYYFSVGYLDENGYLRTSGFDRFSGRASVNVKPTSYMKVGLNVNATHQKFLNTSTGSSSYVNPFMYCRNISPIYPVHIHDVNTGEYILDSQGNKQWDGGSYIDANGQVVVTRNQYADRHVIWENEVNQDVSTRNTMNAIAYAEFYFLKDFTFTVTGNMNLRSDIEQSYNSAEIGDGKGNNGRGSRNEYNYKTWSFQQQLRWSRQFGEHFINALVGHENYSNTYDYLYGYKTNEVFPNMNNLRNFTDITNLYNYANYYRTESYLSRVRYSYADKYNVEASFRRDGSSRFATKARWGNFWSVGANWLISKEAFMQNVGWVNTLKLRADFGEVGNDAGSGLYGYQALYTSGQNANAGAYWLSQLSNYDLMWETAQSWGVGIEARLFNRWNLNVEYFDKRNKDLLFDVILPISAGPTSTSGTNPSITQNIGTMSNRGVEIETDIDVVRTRDFHFNINANATFLKSKIISLPEQNKDGILDGTKKYVEGGDRYAYFLYHWAGVDQMTGLSLYTWDDEKFFITDDGTATGNVLYGTAPVFDDQGAITNGVSVMSDENYILINGTPYVYNPGSYGKRDWCGTATPTVYGSFGFNLGWKGLTLSTIFTYSLGSKVYDGVYASLVSPGTTSPSSVHHDVWRATWTGIPAGMTETSADRISTTIRPQINGNGGIFSYANSGTCDRWLISGNYLVLKNIALSYSFPKRWVNRLEMDGITLNVACENAFTLTHRQGMNPQQSFSGTQSNNYWVTARVFTGGITFKF